MSIIRCAKHETRHVRLPANVYNLGSGEPFENFKTPFARSTPLTLVSERLKVMNERITLRV